MNKRRVLTCTGLGLCLVACRTESDPKEDATSARVPAGDLSVSRFANATDAPVVARDALPAVGAMTVTGTPRGVADGNVAFLERAEVPSSNGDRIITFIGRAARLEHDIILAFGAKGDLNSVTHSWRSPDDSIVGQADCAGARCSADEVTASRDDHSVTFRNLTLRGLDGNTGATLSSRITGSIR